LIGVSLLAPPEPKPAIDSFFDRLRTSSDVQDAGTGPTRPLLLVNLLHLRRAVAERGWGVFREDLVGFGIGWVLVIVLVIITAVFLKM
jgi:hypothetical protein